MFTATLSPAPTTPRVRALAPDRTRSALLLFIAIANAGNVAFAGRPGLAEVPHGLERFVELLPAGVRRRPRVPGLRGDVRLRPGADVPPHRPGDRAAPQRLAHRLRAGARDIALLRRLPRRLRHRRRGLRLAAAAEVAEFHRIALVLWGVQTVSTVAIAITALAGFHSGHAPFNNAENPSLAAQSLQAAMIARLHDWPVHTLGVLPIVVVAWLGIWAAQHRILEHPERHTRLLAVTAVVGLGITVLSALPEALVGAGWLHVDAATLDQVSYLHDISGEYGGPGYVALFALLAVRLSRRGGLGTAARAVTALGRRSLSGYLTQSVVWTVLLLPWTLHLGSYGSTVTIALVVAVATWAATWAATCAAAYALERRGHAGPAEHVLRRLAYRRSGRRNSVAAVTP